MMWNILKVEIKKILPYRPVWIFLGLYVLLLPLIFGFFKNSTSNGLPLDVSKVYGFPGVWTYLTYLGSYFHVLPGFLIIMIVSNEYSYRTFRQNVIDGYSRFELVLGKMSLMVLLSLLLSFYLLLVGLFYGVANMQEMNLSIISEKIYYIPLFALQGFAYMTLALIISVLVKRSALSIILFLVYILIIEKFIQSFLPESIQLYTPENTFSDLIGFPWKGIAMMMGVEMKELALSLAIGFTVAYSALFLGLSYLTLKQRDL
ncbi:MAG TPA: ABC transporter permease [Cytophagales bacterium]|nr:ABC transporter permease [Cytophagales bacterium]